MRRPVQLFELLTLLVLISGLAYWKFAPRTLSQENSGYLQMRSAVQLAWSEQDDVRCLKLCQQMLNQEPGELFALRYVGLVYLRQGDWEQAESWFDRGIARDGHFAEVISAQRLGCLYRERARLRVAQKDWTSALKDATRAKALLNWGEDFDLASDVKACALVGSGQLAEARSEMPGDWRSSSMQPLLQKHRLALGLSSDPLEGPVLWHVQPCPLCK